MVDPWRRFPTLLMARRNLGRATVRSALASLGIVIGVLAIASLGVFGATLQTAVTGSIGDIGNQLVVQPAAEEGVRFLTDADVREIRRVADDAGVVPVTGANAAVSFRRITRRATVYGMDAPGEAFSAQAGRIPDQLRSGALVGAELASELGVDPGSSLRVRNRTYRIRAVLEQQQGFTPINPDTAVVIPADDVPDRGYSMVVVTARSGDAANATAVAIRAALNDRNPRVSIFELRRIVQQIGAVFEAVNLFLVGIGSISLVVAGVSILNVMLMGAIERREEIGVLRAVGYQRRDVLSIMLSEALLLGAMGGLAGALLSIGGGLLVNHLLLGTAAAVLTPPNAFFVATAVAFGILISLISGVYPAYKAASERPVDALRK